MTKTKTISFFQEISEIPRESGHEEKIAQYLCGFAKQRNLDYQIDQYHNVCIKKKTCDKPPIILQAHMDMVCEKEETKQFDFALDSIELKEENGYLKADRTTLGADNGIGVAQILAVLDSDLPCHIEAVFTVSEETSMIGAISFDTSQLKGKMLLNLDGFEENVIIIESACFYDIILKSNYQFETSKEDDFYEVTLTGMPGGHSGTEIDKQRGNASVALAILLSKIEEIQLSEFVGGTKFNVIPYCARAVFTTEQKKEEIKDICRQYEKKLQEQYPNVKIALNKERQIGELLEVNQTKQFLESLLCFPHGVIAKNEREEVIASINMGVVDLKAQEIKVGMRSSRKQEENACIALLKQYSIEHDFKFTILGSQPGFESKEDCQLIQTLVKAHPTSLFQNQKPSLKSMHIAVEVGFFKEKIPDLQIAIISPNIQGAHTPTECVEIASIQRADEWLWHFLEKYK